MRCECIGTLFLLINDATCLGQMKLCSTSVISVIVIKLFLYVILLFCSFIFTRLLQTYITFHIQAITCCNILIYLESNSFNTRTIKTRKGLKQAICTVRMVQHLNYVCSIYVPKFYFAPSPSFTQKFGVSVSIFYCHHSSNFLVTQYKRN